MNIYRFANANHTDIHAVEDGVEKLIPVNSANADFCRLLAAQVEIDPFPLPQLDLSAYLTSKRWEIETGGIAVEIGAETIPVSTARGDDRDALHSNYTAIRDGLRQDGATFKFADSRARQMTNAHMMTIILAALGHVQACFDVEGGLLARIEAGETITTQIIDAALAEIPQAY